MQTLQKVDLVIPIAEIATAADPIKELAKLSAAITVEDDGSILIFGAPIDSYTPQQRVDFRAAFQSIAARMNALAGDVAKSVEASMVEDGAVELYHPRYEITYAPTKGQPMVHAELLYNELTRLADDGKCDPTQVRKAVSRVETVEYKTNLTSIKPLLKLGGEVAKAIDAAVIPGTPGPARLSIKERK
jgi:hypothetical protein